MQNPRGVHQHQFMDFQGCDRVHSFTAPDLKDDSAIRKTSSSFIVGVQTTGHCTELC